MRRPLMRFCRWWRFDLLQVKILNITPIINKLSQKIIIKAMTALGTIKGMTATKLSCSYQFYFNIIYNSHVKIITKLGYK